MTEPVTYYKIAEGIYVKGKRSDTGAVLNGTEVQNYIESEERRIHDYKYHRFTAMVVAALLFVGSSALSVLMLRSIVPGVLSFW